MYILLFLYSFAAGVAAYFIFQADLLSLLIFLLVFEICVYIMYRQFFIFWNVGERYIYNILFFLGYFSFYILYEDFENGNYSNDYNNNII